MCGTAISHSWWLCLQYHVPLATDLLQVFLYSYPGARERTSGTAAAFPLCARISDNSRRRDELLSKIFVSARPTASVKQRAGANPARPSYANILSTRCMHTQSIFRCYIHAVSMQHEFEVVVHHVRLSTTTSTHNQHPQTCT